MGQPDVQRVVGANASAPGYNDLIVGIIFVVHVIVIVVCMFAFLGNGASIDGLIDAGLRAKNTDLVRASMVTAVYATLFSIIYVFIYLLILKVAALLLIVVMMLAVICLTIGGGIGLIAYAVKDKESNDPREFSDEGYALSIIGGILLAVTGAVLLLWFCCIRSRVLLTAKMLSAVSEVIFTVPGTILVTFAMAILQFVWSFVWGAAMLQCSMWVGARDEVTVTDPLTNVTSVEEGDFPWGAWTGMELALLLSFFWGHKVIDAIATTTVASVVAWWYFEPESSSRGAPCCRPVTCTSFKRACTNYLGSIALGSLILAIVETIYYVAKKIVDSLVGPNPNLVVKVAACCFLCILACIKGTVEWITEWAYVFVAIYGVGFCDAGSRVVEMLGHSGAGAIAQQLLTEPVLWLGYLCCAGIGVGSGFLTLETHDHVAGWSQPFWGCLVGFMVGYTALSCVKAGNKAIFVCYADEPALLSQRSEAVAAFLDENKKDTPAPKVLSQVSHAQVELVKP